MRYWTSTSTRSARRLPMSKCGISISRAMHSIRSGITRFDHIGRCRSYLWVSTKDNKLSATQKEGQQATNIHVRADTGYIIGVDIDRSHLALLLTDRAVKIPKTYSA